MEREGVGADRGEAWDEVCERVLDGISGVVAVCELMSLLVEGSSVKFHCQVHFLKCDGGIRSSSLNKTIFYGYNVVIDVSLRSLVQCQALDCPVPAATHCEWPRYGTHNWCLILSFLSFYLESKSRQQKRE